MEPELYHGGTAEAALRQAVRAVAAAHAQVLDAERERDRIEQEQFDQLNKLSSLRMDYTRSLKYLEKLSVDTGMGL
jgi:hypothetical protein